IGRVDVMALAELTQKQVESKLGEYCDNKVPAHVRDQVRLSFSFMGNTVTLFEERPVQNQLDKRTKIPIAQFRLNVVDHLWRLYCANPKRQEGWALYRDAGPTTDFETLVTALDQDTTGVFWG
ncbi:MAG: DUF3024 domain-containing protein, partial [Proteobacteria bacterium]|nr:DUF3024 domain-containing protein [Pseudomonadota bacterium]